MNNDDADADAFLGQALSDAAKRRPDGSSVLDDFRSSFHALSWLQVLAAPNAFRALSRCPSVAHLLGMLDAFVAYVRRDERDTTPTFAPVPYELREERAIALRRALLAWTPPMLDANVVHAARQLLEAEGLRPPEGWDNLPLPPGRMDDYLLWPDKAE